MCGTLFVFVRLHILFYPLLAPWLSPQKWHCSKSYQQGQCILSSPFGQGVSKSSIYSSSIIIVSRTNSIDGRRTNNDSVYFLRIQGAELSNLCADCKQYLLFHLCLEIPFSFPFLLNIFLSSSFLRYDCKFCMAVVHLLFVKQHPYCLIK